MQLRLLLYMVCPTDNHNSIYIFVEVPANKNYSDTVYIRLCSACRACFEQLVGSEFFPLQVCYINCNKMHHSGICSEISGILLSRESVIKFRNQRVVQHTPDKQYITVYIQYLSSSSYPKLGFLIAGTSTKMSIES